MLCDFKIPEKHLKVIPTSFTWIAAKRHHANEGFIFKCKCGGYHWSVENQAVDDIKNALRTFMREHKMCKNAKPRKVIP